MKNKTIIAPLVVIFGRTNVGKSTLFNCLTERKKALVSDIEGTTRDSNVGEVSWQGFTFELIDTGGIMNIKYLKGGKNKTKTEITESEDIDAKVQKQAKEYLKEADIILFTVDTKAGLLPTDKQMALQLKKILPDTDNVILVTNKADSPRLRKEIAEFNKLSLGEPMAVSATTGSGTGDLLDLIVKKLKKAKIKSKKEIKPTTVAKTIKVNILGKPNVGKSSLINAILGEEKVIVSPVAHTTREPQDIRIEHNGEIITLVDTAGISKTGQKSVKHQSIRNSLEKLSIEHSLTSLSKSDIALLVIDTKEGITHQDAKLVEEIISRKISLIIIANKWDLIEDRDTKYYTEKIYDKLPFVTWAPIQFTSAKTGEKVQKILDLVLEVNKNRKIEISDNALSKFLGAIVKKHRPVKAKGSKYPFIYELKQARTNPPRFSIRIGSKDTVHFSYIRFIENRLREKFGFLGCPITLFLDKKRRVHGKHEERNIMKKPVKPAKKK